MRPVLRHRVRTHEKPDQYDAGDKSTQVRPEGDAAESAYEEYPSFSKHQIGGTLTLFVEVTEIEAAYAILAPKVRVVMPLEKKWYGMTEFAFLDPDGYVITFAQ